MYNENLTSFEEFACAPAPLQKLLGDGIAIRFHNHLVDKYNDGTILPIEKEFLISLLEAM